VPRKATPADVTLRGHRLPAPEVYGGPEPAGEARNTTWMPHSCRSRRALHACGGDAQALRRET
jgi:hypothetical protein